MDLSNDGVLTIREHGTSATMGRLSILRELGAGSRDVATYAALFEPSSVAVRAAFRAETVVLECYPGRCAPGDPALDEAARSAELLTDLVHWNVARVRAVIASGDDLVVVNELVEGETYADLTADGLEHMPFPIRLRVLVDLLGGLSALHSFGVRPGRAHGGVSPVNVVVGRDGRTRLLRPCNLSGGKVSPASPTLGYVAPELFESHAPADPCADIYGVGVLLWEALCGRRLSVQTNAPALLMRVLLQGPPPGVPEEDLEWAMELIPVVKRALAPRALRFDSAADMAAALRLTAKAHLATTEEVAAFVETAAGRKISQRIAAFAAPVSVGPTFDAVSLAIRRAADAQPALEALGGIDVRSPEATPALDVVEPIGGSATDAAPLDSPAMASMGVARSADDTDGARDAVTLDGPYAVHTATRRADDETAKIDVFYPETSELRRLTADRSQPEAGPPSVTKTDPAPSMDARPGKPRSSPTYDQISARATLPCISGPIVARPYRRDDGAPAPPERGRTTTPVMVALCLGAAFFAVYRAGARPAPPAPSSVAAPEAPVAARDDAAHGSDPPAVAPATPSSTLASPPSPPVDIELVSDPRDAPRKPRSSHARPRAPAASSPTPTAHSAHPAAQARAPFDPQAI